MRADTLRRHIDVHSWVGIIAGLALFVAFFAGALNMFHHELHHWQEPRAQGGQHAPADAGSSQAAGMQTLLDQALATGDDAGQWLFLIPGDDPSVAWREVVDGEDVWHSAHAGDFNDDGQLRDQPGSELAEFVNELHYELALPDNWGLYLMGLVSVLYGAALIGGLVIHWPKLKKELFALKHQGNLRRYWKNLHNLVGVISFPFHLIFAVTGAAMGCFALITVLMSALVFGPQFQSESMNATEAWPHAEPSGESADMAGVSRYLEVANAELPELEVGWIEMQSYGDRDGVVDVGGSIDGNIAHYSHVVMRADNAEVLTVTRPGAQPFNQFVISPVYSLHFGDYGAGDLGGLFVRVLYFVLALLGCLLFFSGNVMWAERRTDRHGPSRSAAVMLRVTLGVTFGVMAGIAVAFLANKLVGYSAWAEQVAWAEKGGFLATLLLTLLAAFRLPPLATVRVGLLACIGLYLLVPVVQTLLEGVASWLDWDVLLVNGSLIAVAASLFLVERLRARRSRLADVHPLWAAPVRGAAGPVEASSPG